MARRTLPFLLFLSLTGVFLILPHHAFADDLGQSKPFFVNPAYDQSGRTSITASLRAIGSSAYFYVDDGYWNKLNPNQQDLLKSQLTSLTADFDTIIYPTETKFWGFEAKPGIDGDPRVTILLEDLIDTTGGYFENVNGYPRTEAPQSNEREMITVSVEAFPTLVRQFISHEFQHLISFNQKELTRNIADDVWLNELRSEYSITLTGYNNDPQTATLVRRLSDFLRNPSDSVTEWSNTLNDYASIDILGEYLAEQYSPELLSDSLHEPSTGITSLNQALAAKNYRDTFETAFQNWMIADYLNDSTLNPEYSYTNSLLRSFHVSPSLRLSADGVSNSYVFTNLLKSWQPRWLQYDLSSFNDPSKSALLEFMGDADQEFIASAIVEYETGSPEVFPIPGQKGTFRYYVINDPAQGKKIRRITLAVTNATKQSGFGDHEPSASLSTTLSFLNTAAAREGLAGLSSSTLQDGVLIKQNNVSDDYVITGRYKRYLMPPVIVLYGQLDPKRAITVDATVFNSYITSNYIRAVGDQKVYAVWSDGTKHWLHMSGAYFASSGRDFNAVFVVSAPEFNYYKTGVEITR